MRRQRSPGKEGALARVARTSAGRALHPPRLCSTMQPSAMKHLRAFLYFGSGGKEPPRKHRRSNPSPLSFSYMILAVHCYPCNTGSDPCGLYLNFGSVLRPSIFDDSLLSPMRSSINLTTCSFNDEYYTSPCIEQVDPRSSQLFHQKLRELQFSGLVWTARSAVYTERKIDRSNQMSAYA